MISRLIELEGGYVNDPADPGGETKYGISKRSYPHLDIRNLTVEQATEIYQRDWVAKYSLDAIKDKRIATQMLLVCVNRGALAGFAAAREALGTDSKLLTNLETIRLINAQSDPRAYCERLKLAIITQYYLLVSRNSKFRQYLLGWLGRVLYDVR